MEEKQVFHLRRMVAQWAQWSSFLDPRIWGDNQETALADEGIVLPEIQWNQDNLARFQNIKAEFFDREKQFRERGHVQTMSKPKTVGNILAWISAECRNGRKVICIDSISSMRGDQYGRDQERLLDEGKQIVEKYNAMLVMVCHPRKSDKPKPRPVVGDLMGAAAFERFSSTILYMTAHKSDTALFASCNAFGEKGPVEVPDTRQPQSYNRTMWVLKSRLNKFIGDQIGFQCNGGTLAHEERGWL